MTEEARFLREISINYKEGRKAASEPLTDPRKIFDLFSHMQNEAKEKLVAISLDAKNRVISFEMIALGSVHSIIVKPFEIFRASIVLNATGLALVHNHPSGDPTPSNADRKFTRTISDYGRGGGIELLDHVIIGNGRFYSLKADKEYQC